MRDSGTPIEVQREAIKGEVEQRVAQELAKQGLDKLTFSPETLQEDWKTLLDYYGTEALPHAINIYSVQEVLKEYAPDRSSSEVSNVERDKWSSQLRSGEGYDQPFGVPIELTGLQAPPDDLFGNDHLKRYRAGERVGDLRNGEPIFVGTERFGKIAQELRTTMLERVTNPQVWNGQRLGISFLGQIKKRLRESAEQELIYGGGSSQERAEQLRQASQKYFGQIFKGKKR